MSYAVFRGWHNTCVRGRVLLAHHSLQFRVHTRVILTLLVAVAATAVLWAEPPHRILMREATAAMQAGDTATTIAKLEAVRELRPDYPRARSALAGLYANAGRPDDAVRELSALADRGLVTNLARNPAFASMRDLPAFAALAERFTTNAAPIGTVATELTLPAHHGIIESIAVDAQGRAFFGDVRNRCIWVRSAEGEVTRFSQPQDRLLGVFGLALDEARGVLWAGVSAVPEMAGFTAADRGLAYLAEYDLRTGALRRSLPMATPGGEHVFGSLRIARDGSVFVSDSASPVIWRAAQGATHLEAWLEHGEFVSLQGLDFTADGRTLYVADYANGIWAIDVATKNPTLLRPAEDTSLFGLDDLHFRDGALIAVQNGVAPVRIVRLTLGAEVRATVLARSLDSIADAATGTLIGDRFVFVGNSGWSLFEGAKTEPAARDILLLALSL